MKFESGSEGNSKEISSSHMSNQANGLYEFGPFRLDASKRLLTRAGEPVTLAPKTFELLLFMVQSEGRALSKRELMTALWPDTFVEEANLNFQITTLRKALEDEGVGWIETVPKHGYRFATTVTEIAGDGESAAVSPTVPARPSRLFPWAVAALGLLGGLAIGYFRRPPPEEEPVTRFALAPPENTNFNEIAISPDGRRLAFTARAASGATQLWVRPLDSLYAQLLAGTEGASLPFWSPDSRSVGFFAAGKLKKIEASGGPPQTLCNALPGGGAWNRDGVIIFSRDAVASAPLYRVSAAGGEPQPVTALDAARQETNHQWPQFLPDGQHFLFSARGSQALNTEIHLGSLDSQNHTRLLAAVSSAAYASGYLLFVRERALLAQPFDLARLTTAGEAVPVAEPVLSGSGVRARFSVSQSGVLVYDSSGEAGSSSRLLWFDRAGKPLGSVGDPGLYLTLNLSPDDRSVAAGRVDPPAGTDIWLFELARGVSSRLTFGPGFTAPVWSPDGSRIAFLSTRDGPYNLYQKLSNGAGGDEPLLKSSNTKIPLDWSRDGRFLLYAEQDPKALRRSLWILPLEGGGKPFPFLRTAFNEVFGQFSPDGRWIAYTSNESGRDEVYVRPFSGAEAGAGGKWQISNNGGSRPRWRRDGKELFYLALDNQLTAVAVQVGTAALQAGIPQPLFQTRATGVTFRFAVTAGGRRFLVISEPEQAASAPATVVLNWTAALKK